MKIVYNIDRILMRWIPLHLIPATLSDFGRIYAERVLWEYDNAAFVIPFLIRNLSHKNVRLHLFLNYL